VFPDRPNALKRYFEGDGDSLDCLRCRNAGDLDLELHMAFQPIVDLERQEVFAWEALVRGKDGALADVVMAEVAPDDLYIFDQTCRVLAIATAARLGMQERLSINFLPRAVYEPAACIRLTLAAARKTGFPSERLIFELSEREPIENPAHTLKIVRDYRSRGFLTAFDDFGAGYAGMSLLADFQPDLVKLDRHLVSGIADSAPRQAIVRSLVRLCAELGVRVIAEGVETREELSVLRALGVTMVQGYFVARPAIDALPAVSEETWV